MKPRPRNQEKKKRRFLVWCIQCHRSFERRCELRRHLSVHTGVKPYTCLVCTKKFISLRSLQIHFKSHNGNGMHPCDRCHESFYAPEELAKHATIHTGSNQYKCSVCQNRFPYSSHLFRHKKTHNTLGNRHRCRYRYCSKFFLSYVGAVIHQKTHAGGMKFSCPVCEKRFAWHSGFKRHIKTHSRKKSSQNVHKDSSAFNRKDKNFKLTKHKKQSSSSEKVSHKPTLKLRIRLKHADREKVNVESIPSQTDEKTKAVTEKLFYCELCLKTFSSRAALSSHVKWKHDGQEKVDVESVSPPKVDKKHKTTAKFSCKLCSKNFSNSSALMSHVRWKHGTQNKVKVESIQQIESIPAMENEIIESSVKTFPCTLCLKTFYHAPALAQHVKWKHK